MIERKLLTTGNPKTAKGEGLGYLTAILHLAPFDLSGRNVCPDATAQCVALCLNTAGRGGIFAKGETTNAIQRARIRKTRYFFANRSTFLAQLANEIRCHVRNAKRHGLTPAIRLNGTSDLAFERFARGLFEAFPDVTFYDYTKSFQRMSSYLNQNDWPKNYSLTFSRSESNAKECSRVLASGGNVAVVFSTRQGETLPAKWNGYRIIDGDTTDLRFLDPFRVIVGLRAKGKAKHQEFQTPGGFVVTVERTA